MNEPDNSKQGMIAAVIAIPIMIACCAAPVFTLGLATAAVGWISGIGLMEIMGLLLITAAIAFGLSHIWGNKKRT